MLIFCKIYTFSVISDIAEMPIDPYSAYESILWKTHLHFKNILKLSVMRKQKSKNQAHIVSRTFYNIIQKLLPKGQRH
jgi:hypothetical protein